MRVEYKPKGVCAAKIIIDTEGGIVRDVVFVGGCDGNAKGVAALVRGMRTEEVIARLDGITCGRKGTSCPAQLAQALRMNML
ncbi:MAG: TIGR03905 family TSCPD domain-containing protein [Oscillospiraceae bacterium]